MCPIDYLTAIRDIVKHQKKTKKKKTKPGQQFVFYFYE